MCVGIHVCVHVRFTQFICLPTNTFGSSVVYHRVSSNQFFGLESKQSHQSKLEILVCFLFHATLGKRRTGITDITTHPSSHTEHQIRTPSVSLLYLRLLLLLLFLFFPLQCWLQFDAGGVRRLAALHCTAG